MIDEYRLAILPGRSGGNEIEEKQPQDLRTQ